MSYPPTPSGMMPYGQSYYPQYTGYSNPATPNTMQPPYPYPFPPGGIPPGYMPGAPPGPYGLPPPQAMQAFYGGESGHLDEDEDAEGELMDEDEEDVDMEMPLDEQSAEKALKHLIYTQLFLEGFDGGKQSAVDKFFHEVVSYMQDLYLTVQNYGAQAGRSAPNAQDFVVACEELGITPHMLKPKRRPGAEAIAKASKAERSAPAQKPKRRRRKKRSNFEARHANLIPRDLSSPEPDLLPSEEMPHIPNTLRAIHNTTYLPSYPPKHTYIRSPPSPPQRSSLTASLDKRMQNTAKVRAALKNLMDAADIQEEAEENRAKDADGKLRIKLTQSSLVNWQDSFTTTRKRWKVSR